MGSFGITQKVAHNIVSLKRGGKKRKERLRTLDSTSLLLILTDTALLTLLFIQKWVYLSQLVAIITLQSQSWEGQESADKAGSEPWHSYRDAWLNIAGGQNWKHIPLVLINLCVFVFLCINIYCQNVAFSWQDEVDVSNVILGLNNALQGARAAATHRFLWVKMQIAFLSPALWTARACGFQSDLLFALKGHTLPLRWPRVSRYFYSKIHMPDICDIIAGSPPLSTGLGQRWFTGQHIFFYHILWITLVRLNVVKCCHVQIL